MIYLFDKDEKLIKIVRKSAVKTALQKYALTTERYVSDRLTVELKGLNADELEQIEYMAIQTMEDAHTFHYFYVAQKFSDELTTLIGVQSGIEELRKSPVYDKRPQNALARDVITDLLTGTNWQARFVGETTPHSTNFYYTSVFDALKKVCDVWDLEMQFFVEMNGNGIGARYIDFKQRIGEAVGKRVVYGHNALQILQEVERTNIYTALVGRGKGEETTDGYGRKITFESVVWSTTQGKPVDKPAGQKYLELPLMTMEYGIKNADGTMRPKIGFVDFSEEENPEVLIKRTYKALVDAARPQLTLKTSSVYLKGVKVGDTIRVVRHDKKLDYDTRIFEITFNRLNNKSSDIKLGDRIGESNEAKAQTIADKAVEQFVNNEFSNFVQNLPDYLPSADGFNNNWYGAEDPTLKYPGKVLINDIWYKSDPEHEGHKIMLRWTGEVWEEILRTYDSEALRDRITEEIAQVNQSMQAQSDEHDRQVADILSQTQSIESLANQAKTDAANAITEAQRLDTVERQATETKLATAKSQAVAEANMLVETAKSLLAGQVSSVSTDLSQTKEAIKLLATSATVDALTGRISSAESTLQVQASEIASRVKTSDFDQAKQRISTAESSITQLGNRITTEISETKALIPTEIGATNYIVDFGFAKSYNFSLSQSIWQFERIADSTARSGYHIKATCTQAGGGGFHRIFRDLRGAEWQARTMTYSVDIKASKSVRMRLGVEAFNNGYKAFDVTTNWQRFISTDTVSYKTLYSFPFYSDAIAWAVGDVIYLRDPQLEDGTVATAPRIAEEDLKTDITSVKTTITQTSQGVEQLSTSLATTDGKVSTAETKISQLISDVSSKVSQTDYNTLTGRVSNAETAITQNATEISKRLTSTQVESAITGKGYQTKSDVDSNITGRGYITNSALQPYALSTTVQNLVKETSDSFSRTISETKALIPASVSYRNLIAGTSDKWDAYRTINASSNWVTSLGRVEFGDRSGIYAGSKVHLYVHVSADEITFDPAVTTRTIKLQGPILDSKNVWTWTGWDLYHPFFDKWSSNLTTGNNYRLIKLTSTITQEMYQNSKGFELQIRIDGVKTGKFHVRALMVSTSDIFPGYWTPATEDLATVTALHNVTDTVDSHARTIGAVGTTGSILDNVSKVTQTANGLVTEVSGSNGLKTQVSTLAGSYAIKNLTKAGDVLGQINLNKDGSVKIDGSLVQITGTTYIQDGVISSAKIANLDAGKITTGTLSSARIATNSITGSHIVFDQAFVNKMTANEALFKQLFAQNAFITQVQAVTLSASKISGGILTATNGAMEVNLNAGQILYYTDQAALKRVLGGYPTQFVKFETGTVTGKGSAGVTVIGSNRYGTESTNDGGFVGIRAWNGTNIDQIDVAGDTVRLASSTFDSADGWNVVTLPNKLEIDAYNPNHRASSRVKVGDVWLWKDATTYSSMRDTINLIIDNLQLLHNNKTTGKAYSYTMPAKV